MKKYCYILILLLPILACKRINPEKPKFDGEISPLPKATSKVNVPLTIPLSYIEKNLNQKLSEKLYSEKGLDMGNGLHTDLDVLRKGEISLKSLNNNHLQLELPLQLKGKLNIEKEIFGQVISSSLPFDESLAPRVSFEPEIGRNWDVNIKNIQIESWGRSLKYNLLGYEIDFDPILRKHVQKMLNSQLTGDNLTRISFRNMIQETWQVYGKPVKLEQNGFDVFVYSVPKKIKVKESLTANHELKMAIGIEGEVFTQVGSKPEMKVPPLPDLYYNGEDRNYLDVTLPIAIPYQSLNKYLNKEMAGKTFQINSKTQLTPRGFTTQQFGDRALVEVEFTAKRNGKKDLQGKVFLVARPTYDPNREAVVFEDIDFDLQTKNILAKSASWMHQGKVLEEIRKYAEYPIGDYIREARLELQKQGYIETDFATFRVKRPELDVEGIYTTKEDIRIYLRSTGQMGVELK
ncbi:DUF4403 family protein [Echinicola jeungdonensis]|uniref:DUF4403 family protein n=1 Tax=Echinicola jeungdonensis TaxID=709343 RepID=A0ABV5J6F6_9BACT|nr:DUF4403 family protein [Echinicola jeungdonensis]MDN3668873.1 DUF4403 family protein [Echinicola jeungdonensis]